MYNYCLYNEIGKEYIEDAKFLLEKYDFQLINPDIDLAKKDIERIKNIKHDNISHFFIDKTGEKHYIFRDKMSNNDILENLNKNKALHDIDRIYYYCYGKAYNHTFYNISTYYMESRLNIKKKFNKMYPLYEKLANVEDLIQEHCLITSLYTVQYLLNKHEQFTAKQLSDIENMGHDYFVTSKKSKDLLIENKEIYNKILPVLKEIDGMVCNGEVSNLYLGQAFSSIYQNEYIKCSVPQFLSNYSYSILSMYKEFPLSQLLNEIYKEQDNSNKNKKIKNFLMEYLNHCNYFMTDKEKSTDIDKILFHYQKENTFNYQLISKLFFKDLGENKKNAISINEDIDINLIKECMLLPNGFSKFDIYNLFHKDVKKLLKPKELLETLRLFIFPLFEKLFFISFFEYTKLSIRADAKTEDILKAMNDKLKAYFEKNKIEIFKSSIDRNIDSECIKSSKKYKVLGDIYGLLNDYFNFGLQKNYKLSNLDYEKVDEDLEEQLIRSITNNYY